MINTNVAKMDGTEKVAMLVKILGVSMMSPILKSLPRDAVEKIDKIVKADSAFLKADGVAILNEFNSIGNIIVAANNDISVIDEYDEALMADSPTGAGSKKVRVGFYMLAEQPTDVIYRIIKNEEPLYQVVILKQLKSKVAQDVFSLMSTDEQVAFTLEGKSSGEVNPEILELLSRTIETKIEEMLSVRKSNFDTVLNLASSMDDKSLDSLLEKLPEDIAEEVRAATVTFKDLLAQKDDVLQILLGSFGSATIALAMVNCTESEKEKIFGNVTDSKAGDIKYNLGEVDTNKVKDISNAQREIVLEAKSLQQKGDIEIVK
ncbi:Flagellar motor switch protein FliG [Vibrio chagasii]|nr:Flagellar motor switch protein FliG [Vibrio chagasii]